VSRLSGVVEKLERHEDEAGDVHALVLRLIPPSPAPWPSYLRSAATAMLHSH
jgi:hypothetical protein